MTRVIAIASCVLLLSAPGAAQAERVLERGETVLNVGLLLQPHVKVTGDANPNGGVATDPAIRRARILLFGDVNASISFFVQSDSPNIGAGGDWTPQFYIVDAFATFRIVEELQIDAGLILVPLSHHALQGATTLGTLDYHSSLLRFPKSLGKAGRDVGVQARGLLLGGLLHYRAGVFNGIEGSMPAATDPPEMEPLNANDVPRFAGQLRLNVLGKETGAFFSGIYFASEPMLSFGIGADVQPNAIRMGMSTSAYLGLTADAFAELPTGEDQEVIAQLAFHRYHQGDGNTNTGIGVLGEVGYRWAWLEPLVSVDWFRPDVESAQVVAWRAGANFWIDRHRANVKAEVGENLTGEGTGTRHVVVGSVQAQLYF